MHFANRSDAGRQLAEKLSRFKGPGTLVLGLPRGGLPVAYEVAQALGAPLDLWSVRKVGAPFNPELGMGAVAEGGAVYIDHALVAELNVPEEEVERRVAEKSAEVAERALRLREGRPPPKVRGRTVLLVDDGIATGGTARAAIEALKEAGAARVVLAVPVAASDALTGLAHFADETECVISSPDLYAIGAWYRDFSQVSDDEVIRLIRQARDSLRREPNAAQAGPMDPEEVAIPLGNDHLDGTLTVPEHAIGLVLFAHGSGSSRFSKRNRKVAQALQRRGLATLLFDLLTADEERLDERTGELRFDIGLLASRLMAATRWVARAPAVAGLPIGYFGASTGAGAALVAGARLPDLVRAVVSRGGRPDLAVNSLERVHVPVLLIVGGDDHEVLELNRAAMSSLGGPCALTVVPGATHLFEEPGALEQVAQHAGDWFVGHLSGAHLEHPR